MVQKKFKRTDFAKYSKLGVRRKNKQKYRKGKGLDNKMKLNMKGHLRKVKAGFRTAKKTRDLVNELKPILVYNVEDLKKVNPGMIGIIAKIGDKKRKAILEHAEKNNIKLNLNIIQTLSKIDAKLTQAKKLKQEKKSKKIVKDKKAQKEAEKKAKAEEKASSKSKDSETPTNVEQSSVKEEEKEEKSTDAKEIKPVEGKSKEGKKDTLTNNYGRGK